MVFERLRGIVGGLLGQGGTIGNLNSNLRKTVVQTAKTYLPSLPTDIVERGYDHVANKVGQAGSWLMNKIGFKQKMADIGKLQDSINTFVGNIPVKAGEVGDSYKDGMQSGYKEKTDPGGASEDTPMQDQSAGQ